MVWYYLLPAGWFCTSYCHVSGIRLTFASKKLLVTLDDKYLDDFADEDLLFQLGRVPYIEFFSASCVR